MLCLLWLLMFQSGTTLAEPTPAHAEQTRPSAPAQDVDQASLPAAESPASAAEGQLHPFAAAVVPESEIQARVGESLHQILAGAVVGLNLTSTTELGGGSSTFALRMPPALGGANQPLYVLDGVPLLDSDGSRRLTDLIPADLISIEVLKGPAASALYGDRGSYGVILMKTRRGEEGKPVFSFRQSLGSTTVAHRLGSRRFTLESAQSQYGYEVESYWQPTFFDHEASIFQEHDTALETLFSVHGGNGRTRYYLSGTRLGKSGLVAGTDDDRESLRLNLDHQLTDRLALGLNLGFTQHSEPLFINQDLFNQLATAPSFLELEPDGVGNAPGNPFGLNPYLYADALAEEETHAQRTTGALTLAYQVLAGSRDTLDVDLVLGLDDSHVTSILDGTTYPRIDGPYDQRQNDRREMAQLALTHRRTWGRLELRSRLGFHYEGTERDTLLTRSDEPLFGSRHEQETAHVRAYYIEEALTGPWYFLSAGLRSDRATRESHNATFFNGAALLSERAFWQALKPWLPDFKLRTAWGRTFAEDRRNLLTDVNHPDQHREWELGLDAGFWSGRGALALTRFDRKVEDLDLLRYIPSDQDFQILDNVRHMNVDGWEASLSLTPMKGQDWHWTARLDYDHYRAKVTRLSVPGFNQGPLTTSLGVYRLQEGWSPTTIVGSNRAPDGSFIPLGDATPDYQLTWHNELQWHAWSLSWLLDKRQGGEAIDITRLVTDLSGTTPDLDEYPGRVDDWVNGDSTPWVHDSSYLRLRELRLAYKPNPSRFSLGSWLSTLEFALSGRNLKTWTDFPGYDPEQGSVGLGSGDALSYPTTKSAYLSISLGFPAGR